MVLAALQNPFSVAPLFPFGHATFRPSLFLVLRLLLVSLSPHVTHVLHDTTSFQASRIPASEPFLHDLHVVLVAGILAVVPSACHTIHDARLLGGFRLPILDRRWVAQRLLSLRNELPDFVAGLQSCFPCGCSFAALFEGRLQWNWSLGFQFSAQRCNFVAAVELLCQNAFGEVEGR